MIVYDTTPLVSVLIPCYNHSAYIIEALDSISESDYPNMELILIDDASQDESYELAQGWINSNRDRFVRAMHIKHSNNLGICSTMNELLNLANGVYVIYLASDDLLLHDGITRQVLYARENNVNFLFADSHLINRSGTLIAESALEYYGKSKKKLSKNSFCFTVDIVFSWKAPWNRFFSKTHALKEIGGFDSGLLFEDRDIVIRILNQGSYAFLPISVTCYRYTGEPTIGLSKKGMQQDFSRADIQNYYKSYGAIKVLLFMMVFCYKEKYNNTNKFRCYLNMMTLVFFRLIRFLIRVVHCQLIK